VHNFIGSSICSFFRGCGCILRLDFLGVTVGMIVTVGFFIIMDWWTGSAASHTKAIIARNKGIWMNTKAQNKSTKITFTIFKFISLYLWLVLSHSVYEMAVENGFVTRATGTIEAAGFHTLIRIFSVVPIILFWIS
jgi:hypothetical protein